MTLAADIVTSDTVYGPLLYVSLYLGTFLHEGAAIAAGAACLLSDQSTALWTATVLIAGIVTCDLGVYGLGALARRSLWLQRLLGVSTRDDVQTWSGNHLLPIVAMCRVVPGLLFPTFLSYGWRGVPFRRFAMTTIAVNVIYVPLLLALFVQFGFQIAQLIQHWPTVSLIAPTTAGTVLVSRWLLARRGQRLAALEHLQPAA